MSETKERKTTRNAIVIALGIICIILAASLIGAFALLNTKSSPQTDLQGWTEGNFYFNVTSDQNINFTISTAGFSSVTITIDAWSSVSTSPYPGFEVFIGFMTVNTTVDYQVYAAQSYPVNPPLLPTPVGYIYPPWSYYMGYLHWPASFKQTYEVTFSKIMVWIWNNATAFSPSEPIWGNVYYYLTT